MIEGSGLRAGGPFPRRFGYALEYGTRGPEWDPIASLGRFAGYLLAVACVMAFLGALALAWLVQPLSSSKYASAVVIAIPAGSSGRDIGNLLEENGVIRDSGAFSVVSRIMGLDSELQAGDYRLTPGMNLFQVLSTLEAGNVTTYSVTLPEGATMTEIAGLLSAKGIVDRDRFIQVAKDASLVYGANPPVQTPDGSLEGYLFPDTYKFVRGRSEEDIVRRLVSRFVEVAMPVIERKRDGAASSLDLHQIVTLASIVEREALLNRERPVIASVFYNRLELGIPLQSCATVNYALGVNKERLTYADLAVESPYNTYKYSGLPPGPIGNPGLASIKAVLDPADTDYLYFVAQGDGSHYFSKTYAEHTAAKRRLGY